MKAAARRRIRIGLTAACGAVAAIFVASCACGLFVLWTNASYVEAGASVVRGAVHVNYSDRSGVAATINRAPQPGWHVGSEPTFGPPLVEWTPSWNFGQGGMFPAWWVRVPLWMPLLLLGAPCGWLWWRHLRRPAHACEQCGYDLSGMRGMVCPECGCAVAEAPRSIRA